MLGLQIDSKVYFSESAATKICHYLTPKIQFSIFGGHFRFLDIFTKEIVYFYLGRKSKELPRLHVNGY